MCDPAAPGGGARAHWGAVLEELQSRQSISAVVNALAAPSGLGLEEALELWAESERAALDAVPEVYLGPVPEVGDFESYLESFEKEWGVYHKYNGGPSLRRRQAEGAECPAGEALCPSVPSEYFKTSFKLAGHRLFHDLRATIELHEERSDELHGHLDDVEGVLLVAVRRAYREGFFGEASKDGGALAGDVAEAMGAVKGVRARLQSLRDGQLRHSRAAERLVRRRARVTEVLRLVGKLTAVDDLEQETELLLGRRDYSGAFALLERHSADLGELGGVAGAQACHVRLGRLGKTVDLAAHADFVERFSAAVLGAGAARAPGAEAGELSRLCACLRQRGALAPLVARTLRDKLFADLRAFLRTQARQALADGLAPAQRSGADSTADISAALAAMSHTRFLGFWGDVLRACMDAVGRFGECALLVAREGGASNELATLLGEFADTLLEKAGVFLVARQAPHQALEPPEWQELTSLTADALGAVAAQQGTSEEQLLDFGEPQGRVLGDAAGRAQAPQQPGQGTAGLAREPAGARLRGVLDAQARLVAQAFHRRCVAEVTSGLQRDRWERADVPPDAQRALDSLLSHARAAGGAGAGAELVEEPGRFLRAGACWFPATPALLAFLRLLATCVSLSREWGWSAADAVWGMHRLLEHFNQLARTLVLGGQAVHMGALKKINATHLALCFQVLSLLEQVLPRLPELLQASLEARGDPSAARAHFDLAAASSGLAAGYADHCAALLEKLSGLLRERCEFHVQAWLGSTHPEAPELQRESTGIDAGPAAASTPHPAAEGLAKDVAAMFGLLAKTLGAEAVQRVFARAFADVAAGVEQRLACGGLGAPPRMYGGGPGHSLGDRLLADVAYLHDQFARLDCISAAVLHLLSDLVRHIQVKLPAGDPLRRPHRPLLDALRRAGRLPQQ
ncbi:unnamed protein product [Prorocentrum cordatum]|uniref:Vacuolar protein sorting-associated protein 54 C-terminal domain-containing protein n=1 Tax=Prorocentrum cordatum TaxID=2364126 RepID=A0ABN9VGM3_9DINO|nr:unnamed protein product [Polarella glacialis]